jgi:AcrR family transcriptional regulator
MPRVSQEYRDARRSEILEAAGRHFAENGFHSTSMQDFFEASGLSAGLVYRYFRSKEELITALAGGALQLLHASVEEAIAAGERPGTEEVVARLLRTIDELDARERIARVAVQVWGEALVNPAVGSAFGVEIARLQAALERLVAAAQAAGQLDRDLEPAYAARALYAILPGFLLQRALDPALDGARYQQAARALIAGRLHLS